MERFLGIIKLFVVVAGILIVLGTAALIWLLFDRAQSPTASLPSTSSLVATSPVADLPEVRADLGIPSGAVVIDMQLDGAAALLLLRTVEGEEYLALIDPATGRRRSLLRLVPGQPTGP